MKLTNYHILPEGNLVRLLNRGDRKAFEEIFNRYYAFLLLFADRLTGDTQESEDLIQEVFIRTWEHRARFDDARNLFNYLKVSVRNGFLNQERSKSHHTAYQEELSRYLMDGCDGADEALVEKELIARLEEIARKLPGKRGQVFLMTHFENCSHEEIAEVLGISTKTVQNLLSEAVVNIRLRLGLSIVLFILLK